eukprot:CAMPEP_0197174280 /NCGR_PEP_ID=MMETSP1423-20130617/870_1 /TAXON_ID=476441 /ORGANISM="Pseudo-nitzschia heimii, Strain UNC1101" /LENGTH=299 /DNA_ID=CAMNT_0042623191 /DNA_START=201 /DNA_END=1100 /DNA_ORIENTATION=+
MEHETKIKDECSNEFIYVASENGDAEEWGQNTSVARKANSHSELEDNYDYESEYNTEEKTSLKSGVSQENSKKKYIQSEMLSYKQQGSYDIPEDVYAFITVAPVCSWPFIFAVVVISTKYIVYMTLMNEVRVDEFNTDDIMAKIVKFFLIPVTVAMQEDLMAVYAGLANARYDEKVLEISGAATKWKFALAYLLQLIDGLLSLVVNFSKMLTTDDVLDVFLNFAALHFLQDIDDVFYALVEKGFFGDDMEHMATVCKQISWPRRAGSNQTSQLLTSLDSLLFTVTFFVCLIFYFVALFI